MPSFYIQDLKKYLNIYIYIGYIFQLQVDLKILTLLIIMRFLLDEDFFQYIFLALPLTNYI